MSINYNFAFKNSKLKRWERPEPKNILASEASLNKKIIYLYQIFNKNSQVFYPPTLVLIASLSMQLIGIYPANKIQRLESKHIESVEVTRRISTLKSRLNTMRKHLKNINVFYSQSTPVYLFAFYLQNSVPQGVQLYDYSISDNGFDIMASAYGIEPLNELITLLIESPVINKGSVAIKEISREQGKGSSNVIVEINGKILKLNLEKRKRLYEESSAEGLLRKLLRFNDLNLLIRS